MILSQTKKIYIKFSHNCCLLSQLKWRILGPNSVTSVLEATNDVYYRTTDGRETTRGTLSWDAAEGGEKSFNLHIRGHTGWEVEKTFVIKISDIQGFPASLGSGESSPAAGNFTLTVGDRWCRETGSIQL